MSLTVHRLAALLVLAASCEGFGLESPTHRADATSPSCSDQEQDGDETDVDCGGAQCPACQPERKCQTARDCESGNCCDTFCEGWLPGWAYRRPILVENDGVDTLTDFQIEVHQNTEDLILAGKMRGDGADIRVTSADRETPLAFALGGTINDTDTHVWAKLPALLPGTSAMYLYYGNPLATAKRSNTDTFVQGIITNPSFEEPGGWTQSGPYNGATGGFSWPNCSTSPADTPDGSCVLECDVEDLDMDPGTPSVDLTQDVTFPEGGSYQILTDVEIVECGNGDHPGTCTISLSSDDGAHILWMFPDAANEWSGVRRDVDSDPLFPLQSGPNSLTLHVELPSSLGSTNASALIDNFRVHKHADLAPTVTLEGETGLCK